MRILILSVDCLRCNGANSRIIIETRSSDHHLGIRRFIAITFHFLFFLFFLPLPPSLSPSFQERCVVTRRIISSFAVIATMSKRFCQTVRGRRNGDNLTLGFHDRASSVVAQSSAFCIADLFAPPLTYTLIK